MSWTQEQLDSIEQAIAEGSLRVRHDGREVTYRSLDDMIRVRDLIRADLGTELRGRTYALGTFSKGLE